MSGCIQRRFEQVNNTTAEWVNNMTAEQVNKKTGIGVGVVALSLSGFPRRGGVVAG